MAVKNKGANSGHQRVVAISVVSGFAAPLVFVGVILFRKAHRRSRSQYRKWNKRLQHEIARWR